MRIVLTLDESLTVGAHIDEEPHPSQDQCLALRDLAQVGGMLRPYLLGEQSYPQTGGGGGR